MKGRLPVNGAEWAYYACLGSAAGLLAVASIIQRQWELALVALAAGAGWAGARRFGWRRLSPVGFLALALAAVSGLWRHLPAAALVVVMALALAAWDLDGFAARLARFQPRRDQSQFVKNHLARLLVVIGIGMALGEAALLLRLSLGLGWVAALGLLAVFILLQALRLLGGEEAAPAEKHDA
jgi:hypothetical protein